MKMKMRKNLFRSTASTNLSNSIIGTITMSYNDSLGLKLVFMGIIDFYFIFFNVPPLLKRKNEYLG